MKHPVHGINQTVRFIALAALWVSAHAGGSGLNIAVVVNEASSDSLALGNHYLERREVPPQNLIRVLWTGSRTDWTRAECQATLIDPVTAQLRERGLEAQVDYLVLSMDLPYRVTDGQDINSTTSVLFYGFKTNDWRKPGPCRISPEGHHEYFGSELPFRPRPPGGPSAGFLTALLAADTLAAAKSVVDRGRLSDGTWPEQTAMLQKTSDPARNVRFTAFDRTVMRTQLAGMAPPVVTNSDQTLGLTGLLGLQTGLAQFELGSGAFVPGAIADSLTSFGGFLFEVTGQTNLLAFLRAGATASYGTVVEPCNYTEKFPDPLAYFYQARGFALAEAYYQSLASPYQGLVVGEPLAAPFARRGSGAWLVAGGSERLAFGRGSMSRGALHQPPPSEPPVLMGTTNLSLSFVGADADRPLDRVDLFLNGTFVSMLTNVPPSEGNRIAAKINRTILELSVPAQATVVSLANALAALANAKSDQTHVSATPVGDRVELVSQDDAVEGAEVTLATAQSAGSASTLTTHLRAGRPRFLDSAARGNRSCEVRGTVPVDGFLRCTLVLTNGDIVSISVTNHAPAVSTVDLTVRLLNLLSVSPRLQAPDGVTTEDLFAVSDRQIEFRMVARSPGFAAAQVQCEWEGSPSLTLDPATPRKLDQNAADLRPRNHLYLTAGRTNLDLTFPWETTAYPDGFHELAAVAYEGSSVRTQTRATTSVRIRNGSLEATLRSTLASPEVAVEATLTFEAAASRNGIARIDLLGTGGWLASATNTSTAAFAVPGSRLGAGRHRFQALVIAANGDRFQTEPVEVWLVPRDLPFSVSILPAPLVLSWPAVLGRTYDVLSGDQPAQVHTLESVVAAPAGGTLEWPVPESPNAARFYRIRVREGQPRP